MNLKVMNEDNEQQFVENSDSSSDEDDRPTYGNVEQISYSEEEEQLRDRLLHYTNILEETNKEPEEGCEYNADQSSLQSDDVDTDNDVQAERELKIERMLKGERMQQNIDDTDSDDEQEEEQLQDEDDDGLTVKYNADALQNILHLKKTVAQEEQDPDKKKTMLNKIDSVIKTYLSEDRIMEDRVVLKDIENLELSEQIDHEKNIATLQGLDILSNNNDDKDNNLNSLCSNINKSVNDSQECKFDENGNKKFTVKTAWEDNTIR